MRKNTAMLSAALVAVLPMSISGPMSQTAEPIDLLKQTALPADYHAVALDYLSFNENGARAVSVLARQFDVDNYTDFGLLRQTLGKSDPQKLQAIEAIAAIYAEFGRALPACFYDALLAPIKSNVIGQPLDLWQTPANMQRDRLWDASIHAIALNTPLLMKMQSILSQFGLEMRHLCNCSNCIVPAASAQAFDYSLEAGELRTQTLQMTMQAFLDQYTTIVNQSMAKKAVSH